MTKASRLAIATLALLGVAALGAPCFAGDDGTYAELNKDSSKSRALSEGRKILEDWVKAEEELRDPKQQRNAQKWADRQREAREEFAAWMAKTPETLGVDLRTKPLTVLEIFDEARVGTLNTKYARAKLDYVKVDDPRGMDRLEYSLWVPNKYNVKGDLVPGIISLHGRVINPKHPAFRGIAQRFLERSRLPIWNYWQDSPAGQEVIVVAPTGLSDGFKFSPDDHFDNLQVLYRVLGELLRNYRVDWDRVFLEVEGEAMRIACEQTFVFAGFIVRERVDDRRSPIIPPEEFFMFENLNGVPLVYIADEKNWEKVGQPVAEALKAAYEKAGASENLLVMKGARDVNDALKGDEAKLQEFVTKHRKPVARTSFTWRFHKSTMQSCLPIEITGANFSYGEDAVKAQLHEKAGTLKVKSSVATEEVEVDDGQGGKKMEQRSYNRIEIEATEAESVLIYLMEGFIKFGLPLKVVVNGKTIVERDTVERDWSLFWDYTVPRRYFMLPIFGQQQDINFALKPQFVPAAPPEGATPQDGEKPADETPPAKAADGAAEGAAAAGSDEAGGDAKSAK